MGQSAVLDGRNCNVSKKYCSAFDWGSINKRKNTVFRQKYYKFLKVCTISNSNRMRGIEASRQEIVTYWEAQSVSS